MAVETEFEPFGSIIKKALSARGKSADDYDHHPEYSAPKYIVRLCELLTTAIQGGGNPACTLAEVVRLESTCTGADYAHKLALRCKRLAERQAA